MQSNTDTPVAELRNLGPKAAERLAELGIHTRGELEAFGYRAAYEVMRHTQRHVNRLMLYSLYGALHDHHWNKLPTRARRALDEFADRVG